METPSQEALLLIADYLERCTPCAGAAAALRQDVAAHELLGRETRADGSEVPVSVASRLRDFPLGLKEGLLEERLVTGLAAEAKPAEREKPDESGGRALGDGTVVFSAPPPRSLLFEPNRAEAEAKRQADILDARDRLIRDCRALRDVDARLRALDLEEEEEADAAPATPRPTNAMDVEPPTHALLGAGGADAAGSPRVARERREELLRREAERNALLAKKADLAELVEQDKAAARDPNPRSSSAFFPVPGQPLPAFPPRRPPPAGSNDWRRLLGLNEESPAREQRLGRRASLSGHQNFAVYSVAFDASGDFVVTGADDYLAKVWHAPSATLCHTLRGHKGVISDVAVSPCNLLVASASDDGTCRLHRLRDGAPVAVLTLTGDCGTPAAPLPPVEAIAFDDATGRLLATGQKHGDARAWDAAALLEGCEDRAWTADGGAWDALVVGAVLPHAPRTRLRGLGARGGLAATGGDDGRVSLFRAPGPGCALARACADAELACAAARRRRADDGGDARGAARDADRADRALSAARDACAGAYALAELPRRHGAAATDLAFSKAGDRLLSASVKACAATVWSWRDVARSDGGRSVDACGVDLAVRSGNEAPRELSAACWTCDDALVVLSSWAEAAKSQRVHVFAAYDGSALRTFEAHGDQCFALAPHPLDGRLVLSGGHDGRVRAWALDGDATRPLSRDFSASLLDGAAPAFLSRHVAGSDELPAERAVSSALDRLRNESAPTPRDRAAANAASPADGDDGGVVESSAQARRRRDRVRALASGPNVAAAEIWAAAWSGDGRRFACVDLAGQVHVFGPETGAAKRAPREQYLATDYGELVWDGRLYAVDAATRLPGHLAPAAHARNAFGDAHGRRPPLFDGRHVPQPAGDDRAKGLARASRALPRGLEGPAADAAAAGAGGRAAFDARLAVANARADLFHAGPPLAKFQATRHWWPRARDVPERDEPRALAAPAPAPRAAPRAARAAGAAAGGNDGVAYEQWAQIQQQPPSDDDEELDDDFDAAAPGRDDDDDDDGDDDDDDDGLGSGDSDVANGRRGLRRLRRGNDAGDDSDDFEGRLLRSRRVGGRRLGGRRRRDDDEPARTRPRRAAAMDGAGAGRRRYDDSDDDESEDAAPVATRSRRRRGAAADVGRRARRRVIDIDDDDDDGGGGGDDDDDEEEFDEGLLDDEDSEGSTARAARVAREADEEEAAAEAAAAEAEAARVDRSVVDRSWAEEAARPRPEDPGWATYVPQERDAVVYVAEAHHRQALLLSSGVVHGAEAPPWRRDAAASVAARLLRDGAAALRCVVEDVGYELPEATSAARAIVAVVTLAVTGAPAAAGFGGGDFDDLEAERPRRRGANAAPPPSKAFVVRCRKCDAPDFLVPLHKYEAALGSADAFAAGAELHLPYVGDRVERSRGAVVRVDGADGDGEPLYPGEPGLAASLYDRVVLDIDGASEPCSPWECEPLEGPAFPGQRPLPALSSRAKASLLSAIRALKRRDDVPTEAFEAPAVAGLDNRVRKSYLRVVPYPVDLQLLVDRLNGDYYRSLDAFRADAARIHGNSVAFNGSDFELTLEARELKDALLEAADTAARELGQGNFEDLLAGEEDEEDEAEAEEEAEEAPPPRARGRRRAPPSSDDEEEEAPPPTKARPKRPRRGAQAAEEDDEDEEEDDDDDEEEEEEDDDDDDDDDESDESDESPQPRKRSRPTRAAAAPAAAPTRSRPRRAAAAPAPAPAPAPARGGRVKQSARRRTGGAGGA